jgi:hypothetical protein
MSTGRFKPVDLTPQIATITAAMKIVTNAQRMRPSGFAPLPQFPVAI